MAISLFSGTVGSGKSLHTAHEIKNNLRDGRNVISTVNIDTTLCFMTKWQEWLFNKSKGKIHKWKYDKRQENFYFVDILDVNPEYLYKFAAEHHKEGKERQTYLYLDECVAIFSPTCETMQNLKKWEEWQTFFRVCRQIGYEVIIVPQASRLISRKVVECCELDVRHYNKKYHGNAGFFLSLFLGGLFVAATFWRGEKRECISQTMYTCKPLYYKMYNSYTLFGSTLKKYKEDYEFEQLLHEEEQKKQLISDLCQLLNYRKKCLE